MSAWSRTKSQLPEVNDEKPSTAAKVLSQIIERGARVQEPAITAYVGRLREHYPGATPAEIIENSTSDSNRRVPVMRFGIFNESRPSTSLRLAEPAAV